MNIKVGDKVKIFQDPLTRLDFEGIATVKEILSNDLATWNNYKIIGCIVIFDKEEAPYYRQIYLKPLKGE